MALEDAKEKMEKAIGRLEGELSKIRAGKAHPSMLESVRVVRRDSSVDRAPP